MSGSRTFQSRVLRRCSGRGEVSCLCSTQMPRAGVGVREVTRRAPVLLVQPRWNTNEASVDSATGSRGPGTSNTVGVPSVMNIEMIHRYFTFTLPLNTDNDASHNNECNCVNRTLIKYINKDSQRPQGRSTGELPSAHLVSLSQQKISDFTYEKPSVIKLDTQTPESKLANVAGSADSVPAVCLCCTSGAMKQLSTVTSILSFLPLFRISVVGNSLHRHNYDSTNCNRVLVLYMPTNHY